MATFDYKNEEFLKTMLFEVYSAGFEAGYSQDIDIATAYNKWFEQFKKSVAVCYDFFNAVKV